MASFRFLSGLVLASMLVFALADDSKYYSSSSSSQSSGQTEGSGESSGEMATTESSGIESPSVSSDVPSNNSTIEESSGLHESSGESSGNSGEMATTGSDVQSGNNTESSGMGSETESSGKQESSGIESPVSSDVPAKSTTEESSGLHESSGEESSGNSSEESSGESMGKHDQYRYRRSVHFRQGPLTTSTESTTLETTSFTTTPTTSFTTASTTPFTTASTTQFTTASTTPFTTTISTHAPGTAGNSTCTPAKTCFVDAHCGVNSVGRAGRCIGVFHGTCDCTRCVNGLTCHDDSACGGLIGACNVKNSKCNCLTGYQQNGFATLGKALTQFCNHRACDGLTDTCFGLSCRHGTCAC